MSVTVGWSALLKPQWVPLLVALVGGVLLHSMNVLMLATVLPSIVEDVGGTAMMSWPTTAFLASSIVAATCTGHLTARLGARTAFCAGAVVFGIGALVCAVAPSMGVVVAGRFVQGFGGGVLSAMAYVLVGNAFPEPMWPRVAALLSGAWSMSVLVGPMVGGAFATWGNWRGAFYAVTILAALLAVVAARSLPRARAEKGGPVRIVPFGRVALICLAIAVMSTASVVSLPLAKLGLFLAAVVLLIAMILLDRRSTAPLFPSDAFSPRSVTGVAMTFALLVSIAYSPLSIFVPIFLQGLHGFDPLAAGYAVAGASMGWTVSSILVSGWSPHAAGRMLVIGPLAMAVGLGGVALLMATKPVLVLPVLIALVGLGIGTCWGFGVQRLMGGARQGEGALAASAVATVQQTGFALGAAAAGIVATLAGLSRGLSTQGIESAAFWVPVSFVPVALIAAVAGVRLALLAGRSDGKKQVVTEREQKI
ncbi:MFS transporter [Reyranella sp. MMS21-HV4-11]|uniref:MFS transporter n=1 Tax=Reyranella humidisoli TaxID=2849149 RepID=A0ABS6IMI1_9HYPH|nr:MFS transporter [Reyranella sp. MMS21-HV4-11]MBU8875518.1 MFS transporter [Reyranella sp. MMS21-HV4-11]